MSVMPCRRWTEFASALKDCVTWDANEKIQREPNVADPKTGSVQFPDQGS
jgi:hypothetical protein